ncbi:MAG: MBL fold metallo-hydrolase [Acidobacteria bacterium]|nr:MBL fold metallo-hydrolase [Acidobacteriota bacterium]NIM61535.1 MBL fold metallo-hydrolase [Acidobacteriota bacterium]NIO60546.1 MBL fold metallo-hydrolase [Acidobacteriota bacterium]NIQ31653.1 MBL fold metallo-hydrolase [Acidobacteriota bacterium]NIQ86892.1 MBL fold metallo-hydrolase [Acidobacteriota bacterium]
MTEIRPIQLGFDTCYVLRDAGIVVVDAGQPNKGRAFLRGLSRAAITPEEVGLILLTHAHWDHMGSAAEIKKLTGATLAVHEKEVDWVEHGNPPLPPGVTTWGRIFMAAHRLVMPLIDVPPAEVDRALPDETSALQEFGIPGRVIPTPGHSPGSISVLLDTGEVFVGDLAMNRFPLTLTPGLPIFADDLHRVVESWRRLVELGAQTVFPAHGKPFSIDVIRQCLIQRSEKAHEKDIQNSVDSGP